jgi:hypothetical protein
MERLTSTPSADSQSAECNSSAYYQPYRKSPRSWTCTATFSPCSYGTAALGTRGSPTGASFACWVDVWFSRCSCGTAALGLLLSAFSAEVGGRAALQGRVKIALYLCHPDRPRTTLNPELAKGKGSEREWKDPDAASCAMPRSRRSLENIPCSCGTAALGCAPPMVRRTDFQSCLLTSCPDTCVADRSA